ncbi:MAG: GTPase ObgE [Anaerolineales bacterium]|nr:GTPase ObgE [Anaerolineales bacterium]
MVFDQARITVKSGDGGDGAVHFRREKFVARGGPDGGDGGRGGDVILVVDPKLNTLLTFANRRKFSAEPGGRGGKNDMRGASAEPLLIHVPAGTVVRDPQSDLVLGDLTEAGQTLVVARGGRGGRGNARFASSRNQVPHVAEKGAPGDELLLQLELKLIADVGIVGVPNAGKSTFLASVTAAKPKIASYPFTTLQPNLGVAQLDSLGAQTLVLADIPGLIEGAHKGVGLGYDFLRHVQRTRVLIHLLDGQSTNPVADYGQINAELTLFDEDLSKKPQVVAVTKLDLPDVQARWPEIEADLKARGVKVVAISAATGQGVRELLFAASQRLADAPPPPTFDDIPVYRPAFDLNDFTITREEDGAYRVSGKKIERAARMTYWEFEEAVERFQKILEVLGVRRGLEEAGIRAGDTVRIGEYELEWSD